MPKLSAHVRFPQSMKLFQFCFRILMLRRPSQKINNHHLGQLLNLSPSDTSHWKRGKKALKNSEYIKTLANHLNVDTDILHDLADGSIELDEALADFYDAEKTSLASKNDASQLSHKMRTSKLETLALQILKEISLEKIPVCMTKLMHAFPFIQLLPSDTAKKFATSTRLKPGTYIIRYLKDDTRPHTRFAIVREIATILLTAERAQYNLLPYSESYLHTEITTLSHAILIPRAALADTVHKISTRINLTQSLAETFCVPKSVMRHRLASLLIESATQFH